MRLAAYPACRLWRPRGRRYDPHNQPPLSPNAHHSQFFGRPNTLNSALSCDCCQRQHAALCASLRLHPPSSSTGRGGLRRHRRQPGKAASRIFPTAWAQTFFLPRLWFTFIPGVIIPGRWRPRGRRYAVFPSTSLEPRKLFPQANEMFSE